MNIKFIILLIIAVIGAAIYGVYWNPYDNTVKDPDKYKGCYGIKGRSLVILDSNKISDIKTGSNTTVKRVFRLKRWPVIHTVNNIHLEINGAGLVVGARTTGFFYEIRGTPDSGLVMLLPDKKGNDILMPKLDC